jgi:hypothetical protein
MVALLILIALAALLPICNAFLFARSARSITHGLRRVSLQGMLQPTDLGEEDGKQKPPTSVDVSDLGITVTDLNKPMEIQTESSGVGARGYYSWVEGNEFINVDFQHPGTAGQPAGSMRVDFTETTVGICVFGYAVWMAIPSGRLVPEQCSFTVEEAPVGQNRVPIVKMRMLKSWESQGHWSEAFDVSPNSMLQ